MIDINQRAWDLYRQLQNQRATLKTYEQALQFVRREFPWKRSTV